MDAKFDFFEIRNSLTLIYLMKNKNLYFTSFLLFLLFLSLRVPGIFSLSVQPDEYHWRERSLEILTQFREHNISNLTTHLGQPGVPPALLMAFGDWAASKIGLIGTTFGEYRFDYLYAARFMCAFVSSLIVFPIILLGTPLLGYRTAVLGAVLLALDPHHIGLSRLAHLDTVMSFFVVTSVLYYLLAQKEHRPRYKLLAGFFWGLAVATKPTAATVIVAFVLYNFYLFLKSKIRFKNIVTASDFFAVLIGHLVLSLLYTRLWVHESEYLIRLKIECLFADMAYLFLSDYHYLWPGLLVVCLFVTVLSFLKKGEETLNSYFLLILWSALFIFAFPSVIENLSRFWAWAFGLSNEIHKAYGILVDPPPYGYIGILVRDLTPITIFGLFFSFIFGIFLVFKKYAVGRDETFGLILISTIWIIVLSASSKQTIRYLMPVLCLMFLVLSYFYVNLIDFVLRRIPQGFHAVFKVLFVSIVTLPSFFVGLQLFPYQMMYENSLLCYFDPKFEQDKQRYLVGVNEASKFIRENVGKEKKVFVLGDIDVLRLTQTIISPEIPRVKYLQPSQMTWGYLLVRFHSYDESYVSYVEDNFESLDPIFTSYVEKIPVISVYRMPMPDPDAIKTLRLADFHKGAGVLFRKRAVSVVPELSECPNDFECLALTRERAKRGIFLFGSMPFFDKAVYQYSLNVRLINPEIESDLIKSVLRLKVGSCIKDFQLKDFPTSNFATLTMNCSFDTLAARNVTAFWFGNHDIIVSDIELKRQPGN